jgi:hypothetical protein
MDRNYRSPEVLGKRLIDHQQKVVLEIGHDRWTRQEMIDVLHCGHFIAAANLTRAMKDLDVKSVKDAVKTVVVSELLAIRGIGVTAAYVFMCATAAVGKDPLTWVQYEAEPVTVATKMRHARTPKERGRNKHGK